MPFESEAQRKYLWAKKPEVAKKFAAHENKDYHQAMVGLRRSSAAGTHDNRPNRQRSRADALRAAVKQSRNEE